MTILVVPNEHHQTVDGKELTNQDYQNRLVSVLSGDKVLTIHDCSRENLERLRDKILSSSCLVVTVPNSAVADYLSHLGIIADEVVSDYDIPYTVGIQESEPEEKHRKAIFYPFGDGKYQPDSRHLTWVQVFYQIVRT